MNETLAATLQATIEKLTERRPVQWPAIVSSVVVAAALLLNVAADIYGRSGQ